MMQLNPTEEADLARLAYEAYVADAGGLNYQGLPCPEWDKLTPAIRQHWTVAVRVVADVLTTPVTD
jgi:hypothetical protein